MQKLPGNFVGSCNDVDRVTSMDAAKGSRAEHNIDRPTHLGVKRGLSGNHVIGDDAQRPEISHFL